MRGWLLTIVLWAATLWANAQQFNTHWVAAPDTDSLAHVWFRTTLLSGARYREAHLTIATTGLVKVYVNEAKVGTAFFYPSRPQGDTMAIAVTLDVTPYLRPDSNVVAVLYSPGFPHATRRQVSAVFYGIDSKGQRFAYFSDDSWLWRHAASGLTPDGREWVDGRQADTPWTASDFDAALWRHAVVTQDAEATPAGTTQQQASPCKTYTAYLPVEKIVRSRGYNYFDINGNEVTYDYGLGFRGFVRLNLREAQWGEQIEAAGLRYTCNGQMDEQASPVFTIGYQRRVTVTGDRYFRRDQITETEAVDVAPIFIDYTFQ